MGGDVFAMLKRRQNDSRDRKLFQIRQLTNDWLEDNMTGCDWKRRRMSWRILGTFVLN